MKGENEWRRRQPEKWLHGGRSNTEIFSNETALFSSLQLLAANLGKTNQRKVGQVEREKRKEGRKKIRHLLSLARKLRGIQVSSGRGIRCILREIERGK
jgi:hypothetical protein